MKQNISTKTFKMAQMAILTALIFILGLTPIGFLKIAAIEITFLTVPVAIGGILLGPAAGAFLGGIFGLVSFIQCFGMSAFGVALLAIDPLYTFILCVIPRLLMGYLTGVIAQGIKRIDKTSIFSFGAASLAAPLMNTIFFMTALILLFGKSDFIMGFRGDMALIQFIIVFVGLQGLVEAIVGVVLGFSISKALHIFINSRSNSAKS